MTCINIDCLLVKVSQKRIRFIESKHDCEHVPKSQLAALQILNSVTSTSTSKWKVEYYLVRGDPPYTTVEIDEVPTGKHTTVPKSELIKWLNFQTEIYLY